MAERKNEHNEDLADRILQEVQASNEAATKLATLEQERLATLREVLGAIQSLAVWVGELSGKIDELAGKQGDTRKSLKELHRVLMGYFAYLNNELQAELQAGRVNQEGLGHLIEKFHQSLTESVQILRSLGVDQEGPPGFDKFGGAPIEGTSKNDVVEILSNRMSTDELRILCFNLGVNYDEDLEGDTKLLRLVSFIRYINERHMASQLKQELLRTRPDIGGFNVGKTQRFPTKPLGNLPGTSEKE